MPLGDNLLIVSMRHIPKGHIDLGIGNMFELVFVGDIANGPDARHARTHLRIDSNDASATRLEAHKIAVQ